MLAYVEYVSLNEIHGIIFRIGAHIKYVYSVKIWSRILNTFKSEGGGGWRRSKIKMIIKTMSILSFIHKRLIFVGGRGAGDEVKLLSKQCPYCHLFIKGQFLSEGGGRRRSEIKIIIKTMSILSFIHKSSFFTSTKGIFRSEFSKKFSNALLIVIFHICSEFSMTLLRVTCLVMYIIAVNLRST